MARKRPNRADLVLAAALSVYGQLEVWAPGLAPGVEPADQRGLLAAFALLATAPVAFRRRAPIAALAATTAGIALPELSIGSQDALAPFAAILLEAFSLGAWARPAAGIAAFVIVIALITAGD